MIMDRECRCLHLSMFVLSVNLFVRVHSQVVPQVNISKLLPPGDPFTVRENNPLMLRCDASDLLEENIMEWSSLIMGSMQIIARNGTSLVPRYEIEVLSSSPSSRIEVLTISNFKRSDSSAFKCEIKDSWSVGASILTSAVFDFILVFFPAPTYPRCYPDGPFTVQAGTTVRMNVTIEPGNPQVDIHRFTPGFDYDWVQSISPDGLNEIQTLQLTIAEADEGNYFNFTITSQREFPGKQSSCLIGPITVLSGTTSFDYPAKTTDQVIVGTPEHFKETSQMNSIRSTSTTWQLTDKEMTDNTTTWIILACVGLVLFTASFIINIFFVRQWHHQKLKKKERQVPGTDPYGELQPTDTSDKMYTEPTPVGLTRPQHTYSQTIEMEDQILEDDYEKPREELQRQYESEPKYLTIEG